MPPSDPLIRSRENTCWFHSSGGKRLRTASLARRHRAHAGHEKRCVVVRDRLSRTGSPRHRPCAQNEPIYRGRQIDLCASQPRMDTTAGTSGGRSPHWSLPVARQASKTSCRNNRDVILDHRGGSRQHPGGPSQGAVNSREKRKMPRPIGKAGRMDVGLETPRERGGLCG